MFDRLWGISVTIVAPDQAPAGSIDLGFSVLLSYQASGSLIRLDKTAEVYKQALQKYRELCLTVVVSCQAFQTLGVHGKTSKGHKPTP